MSRDESSLGEILRKGRIAAGMTQADVAKHLKLGSPQSISDWERGSSGSVPVHSLKVLVRLFGLDEKKVFDALFNWEMERLEAKLTVEYYGRRGKRA